MTTWLTTGAVPVWFVVLVGLLGGAGILIFGGMWVSAAGLVKELRAKYSEACRQNAEMGKENARLIENEKVAIAETQRAKEEKYTGAVREAKACGRAEGLRARLYEIAPLPHEITVPQLVSELKHGRGIRLNPAMRGTDLYRVLRGMKGDGARMIRTYGNPSKVWVVELRTVDEIAKALDRQRAQREIAEAQTELDVAIAKGA